MAGYKNAEYRKYWGFPHYGWDLNAKGDEVMIKSMGDGYVVDSGWDYLFGWVAVCVYEDCELHNGKICDLTVRYYHMRYAPVVKAGDEIEAGQQIGIMGTTGQYSSGDHLHFTMDTDVKFPCYEPGIAKDGRIIKRGTDSTIDPAKVVWLKRGQRIVSGAYAGWNSTSDWNLPEA